MFKRLLAIVAIIASLVIFNFSAFASVNHSQAEINNYTGVISDNTKIYFLHEKNVPEIEKLDEVVGWYIHDLVNNDSAINGTVISKDHDNDPLWQDVDRYMLSFNGLYWITSNTDRKTGITVYTIFDVRHYDVISNATGIARTATVVDGQVVYK